MIKTHIREQGLVGAFFEHDAVGKLPGIILVPGSDGGIPEAFAEHIASQGYNVLALGYFALEGLPKHLEGIQLEYFQTAFQWLIKQKNIKEHSIGLIGYSRGGELALLLGSLFPELMNAVIAYVPSSVVCGGFPYPNKPAWLYKNKPITPFLSGLTGDAENFTEGEDLFRASATGKIPFHKNTAEDPYEITELFLARNQQGDILKTAAIPVENIRCPMLIISGEEDKIWPSALYGKLLMKRLDENKSPVERQHLCYPNAGHGLAAPYDSPIYHPVGEFWCKLGGSVEGNARACEASWQEVLKFLHTQL